MENLQKSLSERVEALQLTLNEKLSTSNDFSSRLEDTRRSLTEAINDPLWRSPIHRLSAPIQLQIENLNTIQTSLDKFRQEILDLEMQGN